ncbi:MAG: outer membrane protein transport protein [Methyloprofundus sp.]|nr:outer membrane protein transport protein [Methyloprofundus sp.]
MATNGYFAHGYGARSKAMAGIGAALPQDAIVSAVNPAGLVHVGDRLDIELELFNPRREYTVSGEPTLQPGAFPLDSGRFKSSQDLFLVPTIGWSYQLSDHQAIGLAMYGSGGMNTNFEPANNPICPPGSAGTGTFCAGRTGVDLAQGFLVATYAHSLFDGKLSLGLSPILAVQAFKANGFGSFAAFSADSQALSNKGRDYSVGGGFRIGVLGEPLPGLRLGASYKSRIWMSRFNKYSGLFAEQGDFDIPDSFNIGISWDVTERITTAFDVEHIRYSAIKSIGNKLLPNLQQARLGDNNGAGFGWQDMTIYKFGALWRPNDDWTLRGGVSYGKQPISSSQVLFNIAAPGVQEWHITAGFSRKLWDNDEVSFAFMYSPSKSVKGANPLSPSQDIELAMDQFSWQLAWSRQF